MPGMRVMQVSKFNGSFERVERNILEPDAGAASFRAVILAVGVPL